jgi:hypothetical protein
MADEEPRIGASAPTGCTGYNCAQRKALPERSKAYVYGTVRVLRALYVVEGLE